MMKFKAISIILLLSMMITVFVACAADTGDTGGTVTTTAASDSADVTDEVAQETKTITYLDANLPEDDLDGYTFMALSAPHEDRTWKYFDVDEINGEPLNDSIYQRNEKIENVFNVKVDVTMSTAVGSDLPKTVNAGDDIYDVVYASLGDVLSFAQKQLLCDINSVPYIDLEREWWDQSIIRDLTVANKLYYITGAISPMANIRTFSLVFNKDLCAELGLDLPYKYVLDGTWTMDMFAQYAQGVNRDLNGDGVMGYDDLWGYFSQYGNSYMMFIAGGGRVAAPDSNGVPQILMDNEKDVGIMMKALNISSDPNVTLMADPYVSGIGGSWQAASAWFASGGSLLRSSVFEPVPRDYRSMETDFGILPYPKYDEHQENYYSLTESSAYVFSIPASVVDLSTTGLLFEALAAESVSTVATAFYDVCLNGKYIRDNESEAMIDLIFNNKVFDIGFLLNIGGYTGMIQTLEKAQSTDVVSKYESIRSNAQTTLDKYVAALE